MLSYNLMWCKDEKMSKRITTPFPWGCYSYFFVSFWLRKYSLFADRVIMDSFLLGSFLRKKIYQSINKYIMWKSGLKRHKKAQFGRLDGTCKSDYIVKYLFALIHGNEAGICKDT